MQHDKTNRNQYAKATPLGAYLNNNSAIIVGTMLFIWAWLLVYGLVVYKPAYTAEALVLIKDSAVTQDYVTAGGGYQSTTSSNSSNPVLNTMGLLKSSEISDAVYAYFKNNNPDVLADMNVSDEADWKVYFDDGKKFIKAKNKAGTDYISVQFKWDNPQVSKEALSTVLSAFQESSLNINKAEYENRSKYLDEQVKEITQQLEAVRKNKSDYKITNKTVNTEREAESLTHLRSDFQTRLNDVIAQAAGKQAEVNRLEESLGMSTEEAIEASAIGMNATMRQLKDQLYALSQEYAYLSATLTQKNPKVKEVKAKLDQVEQDIQDEMLRTIGKSSEMDSMISVSDDTRAQLVNQLVSTEAETIRLNSQADALRIRLDDIEVKISDFPAVEEGLVVIEESEKSLSESLATLRQKSLEAKLKKAQTLSNVFIVDAPHVQDNADFPTPIHLVLLSVVIGLAAGISIALMKYQWMDYPNGVVIDNHLINSLLGIDADESQVIMAQYQSKKKEPAQEEADGLEDAYLDELLNNFENQPDLVEHILEDQEKSHQGLSQKKVSGLTTSAPLKALPSVIDFNPTPYHQVMPKVQLPQGLSPVSVSETAKTSYQIRDYQAGSHKKDLLSELGAMSSDDITKEDIQTLKEKLTTQDGTATNATSDKEPPAFMNNTVTGPWAKSSAAK